MVDSTSYGVYMNVNKIKTFIHKIKGWGNSRVNLSPCNKQVVITNNSPHLKKHKDLTEGNNDGTILE